MAKVPFRSRFTLKFRDADPAQIMYFGNLFNFAHDAFEEFVVHAGYTYREWFSKDLHIIPIRHAEADFLAPLRPGLTYEIDVVVALMRETSFQMKYTFLHEGRVHGQVKMVHSVLDPKTMEKMPLPQTMRERLTPFLETP